MNSDVPILVLKELKIPKKVKRGTIIISATPPMIPANNPLKFQE